MKKVANVAKLEQQCAHSVLTLLDDMFASCDDLFFDLASRATNNAEQNLYFESMREVRIYTQKSRDGYKKDLAKKFERLSKPKLRKASLDLPAVDEESISIVATDVVEQDVAIATMTSRSRGASKTILHELNCRFAELYQIKDFDEEIDNPLDPGLLCQLFTRSIEKVDIEIKARIILLKQYERFVLNRLPELYLQLNTLLEEMGIVFKDDNKLVKHKPMQRGGGGTTAAEMSEEALLNESLSGGYRYGAPAFSDLSQLLTGFRSNHQSTPSGIPLFASGGGGLLQNQQLLQLLDNNPQQQELIQNSRFDLRSYIKQMLAQGQPEGEAQAVQQVDEDVINLVAMFFDFVLDDQNIPDHVKALVSRLQMPILKVALKDKTFFSKTGHPAREFINEIASLSLGLEESENATGLLEKIEDWIQNIQTDVHGLDQAFEDALAELTSYNGKQQKKSDLVQKRTREAAEGQASKQIATLKSQQAIQEAMDGKTLPAEVSDFVVQFWQQALYSTYIKHSDDSPNWLEQLQVMQDLIWCSQAHNDDKSRDRHERISADLFEKLQLGLRGSALTEEQGQAEIEKIKSLLGQMSDPSDDADVIEVKTFDAEQEESLQEVQRQKGWKEMTALERQKVEFQALTYDFIEKAEAIDIGAWLEFKEAASGTTLRCKLAAKLESSDTYVFVNRLGFKAVEKPRKEFAFDLQRNRARLLKSGPLFERSLHRVVNSLKNIG